MLINGKYTYDMYDLYPYFTNDGSVGLFSQQDDDIYHSTYGALTESWQKFIIPSNLQDYLLKNNEVKILDICYGIGYNTKTALNVFVENFLKNKNNFKKNSSHANHNIAAIGADNILGKKNIISQKDSNKKCTNNFNAIEAIDTDNVIASKTKVLKKNSDNIAAEDEFFNDTKDDLTSSILIDAVDIDKTLIQLSPFIRIKPCSFMWLRGKIKPPSNQNKFAQIRKIQDSKFVKLKKEFRIRKEVQLIIFLKMLKQNFKLDDKILQTILSRRKYSQFLSRFMLNFANFYSNHGCNYNKKLNLSTLLHNIYYQYLSKSYKNANSILNNSNIDLNFFDKDARNFVKSTNNIYDFIFLDAFTPSKCPALWTIEFLEELNLKLSKNGMLLTYSNSAAIRNALLQAGFEVGKIYDKSTKKFVGTMAVKNKKLLEYQLDDHDLGLINSKAGICFRDKNLDLDNATIISNRKLDVDRSELISSSQFLKGYKL